MGEASIPLPLSAPGRAFRLLGDDRLRRAAADGNQRAFAAIYERHHQGIYRYCRSILRNDEDARDALQNTMVKALGALPGETRELALKPWLYRVAHNEAISLIRRRGNEAPIEEVTEIADARGADGATRERLRTLISDVTDLPERQRAALVMRELNGLTYAEIAAALQTSPAAAKQAVYEAREALHQIDEGRQMECDHARRSISADDRRILRGRKLRAHLRSCSDCRTFSDAIGSRRGDLAALAPPLPAGTAAALLQGIIGGGGGGGAGLAGVIGGGSAAVKAGAAALTIAVGVGAYEVAEHRAVFGGNDSRSGSSAQLLGGERAAGSDHDQAAGEGTRGGPSAESEQGGGETGGGEGGGARPGGGGGEGTHPAGPGAAPGHPGNEASSGGGPPGGSPPGLDGAQPPGQGGTPPGLDGSVPPGLGGTPPGQGGTPPGLGGTPPGLGGTPPGLGGSPPPGQGGTPPGQSGSPPGLGK